MTIEALLTLSGDPSQSQSLRAVHFITKFVTAGNIVSVGARGGWMDFALALNSSVQVYTIDDYRNLSPAERAVWNANAHELGVSDRIKRWDGGEFDLPISLLYVDASLSDAAFKQALTDLLPSVVKDGFLAVNEPDNYVAQSTIKLMLIMFDMTLVEKGTGYQIYHINEQAPAADRKRPATLLKPATPPPAAKPAAKRPAAKKKKPVRKAVAKK